MCAGAAGCLRADQHDGGLRGVGQARPQVRSHVPEESLRILVGHGTIGSLGANSIV